MGDAPLPRTFDEEDLAAAVAAGVLPADTAEALTAFVDARRAASPRADEEEVRFVTSFNDIFVTIGIVLVCGGVAFLVTNATTFGWGGLAATVVGWGLSEIFARRWRMAFPSIALTAIVVGAAGVAGAAAGEAVGAKEFAGLAGAAAALAVGWAHWRRFAVPISVAAAIAGAGLLVFTLVHMAAPDFAREHPAAVLLPLGLVAFALAMWWDASDRDRRTRRTDVAFWLHVLAAPTIVHPLVSAAGIRLDAVGPAQAVAIVALFAVIACIALVIDRRALLVSALIYLGVSIGVLIERSGWSPTQGAPLTGAVVGAIVLLLAVGWRPLRSATLRFVPPAIRAHVPVAASLEGSRP
jgi:hypothetical protein